MPIQNGRISSCDPGPPGMKERTPLTGFPLLRKHLRFSPVEQHIFRFVFAQRHPIVNFLRLFSGDFRAARCGEAAHVLGYLASVEIGNLAREIADATQGWGSAHRHPGMSKELADVKIRRLVLLRIAGRSRGASRDCAPRNGGSLSWREARKPAYPIPRPILSDGGASLYPHRDILCPSSKQ